MLNKEKNHKYYNYVALRTTLIYAILSVLWILFSDRLLLTNPATAIYISTIKGWFYTIIVGVFIYSTLARELNQITAAENEIKQFQQLLQSSIDSQKDTILVSIDKNYNCLYFNKAFFEVIKYAYGTEIKLGMNVLDVMTSDEDRKAAKKSYDRALQGESHSTIRIYGNTNLAYYEGFFNPIINESGEIIGATTLARNITERKNMEEKNKWLASFPLLNPWPVIEIDKNVGLVFINDSAKKTFPDLEDKNINHPFIKDLKKYFTELSTGDNFQSKREIKIGDLFYLQAITLVNKQQLRIYAIDITNVKQAEEVLGDEKEKYQKLFYNMINGFAYHQIITDKKGQPIDYKFLEVNPAFEQMTGLKRKNIINKLVTKVLPGTQEDEANWINRYGNIALTGEGKSFEDYSKVLNKWFNISAYSPHTGYFATIFEDITARKENEQRLMELDKLKDNFLSVTTHELKTPLIPIKSQTQLLLMGDYGPLNLKQKKAIEMIERNEESLNKLTSDLMDISKIKSNKLTIISETVWLDEIISNVIEDIEKIAKEKNITISLSPIIDIPKLTADKQKITQVFNNLIGNAIKFTPKNGKISIDVKNVDKKVLITIKDTGIGLSPENIKKLFTPFFQVQNDLNREYRGTGLGLPISKGIIEAHDGQIWAESTGEGQGSTFIFNLPIK